MTKRATAKEVQELKDALKEIIKEANSETGNPRYLRWAIREAEELLEKLNGTQTQSAISPEDSRT